MSDKCILLIDDDEAILEVVSIAIPIEVDWRVLSASSGIEGINLAQTQQPDVILLDLVMPKMDGFATLAQLQEDERTRSIPVFFLTAKNPRDNAIQSQNLGVAGIIYKPFNCITLVKEIAKILKW